MLLNIELIIVWWMIWHKEEIMYKRSKFLKKSNSSTRLLLMRLKYLHRIIKIYQICLPEHHRIELVEFLWNIIYEMINFYLKIVILILRMMMILRRYWMKNTILFLKKVKIQISYITHLNLNLNLQTIEICIFFDFFIIPIWGTYLYW